MEKYLATIFKELPFPCYMTYRLNEKASCMVYDIIERLSQVSTKCLAWLVQFKNWIEGNELFYQFDKNVSVNNFEVHYSTTKQSQQR